MRTLGSSDLEVPPLCLGGNVFGWTADEEASFAVLDAFLEAGGTFIDTADVYSSWVSGHVGGESEAVIGRWMADRGCRDRVVLATKVGMKEDVLGLGAETIARACDASLERLQTDRIDLYYAHRDDEETPQAETCAAFDALVAAGKVRHLAASNFTAERLRSAVQLQRDHGWAEYVALQPEYNLVERDAFEGDLQDACADLGLAAVPYFGLAKGFLTGKYRAGGEAIDSPRAGAAAAYLEDPRGPRVLEALDAIAGAHGVPPAAVALAWVAAQDTVAAPIASARSLEQLRALLPVLTLELAEDELERLDAASA